MEYKFMPRHLLLSEIDYELKIRGSYSRRDRADKIKILSRLLYRESQGANLINLEDYVTTFETERDQINETAVSIASLILDFEGNVVDTLFSRICSRIAHLTGRVQRLEIPEDDRKNDISLFKQEMYATCLCLDADVHEKIISDQNAQSNNTSVLTQQPVINLTSPSVTCSSKNFSLSKWNIKFNGDSKNVFSFLEKISEYACAREVSEEGLFKGFIELVEGKAFTWYRCVKSSVLNWSDLVDRLKKDFLSPTYEDDIWEQIKLRKQRSGESAVIFFAEIETLFSRISRPVCEATKVKYLRRNLIPEYVSQLALFNFDTVQELLALVKRLEEADYVKSKSIAPRRSSPQVNELSNKNNSTFSSGSLLDDNRNSASVCWNCQKSGHLYRACTVKRNKFCFRCGARNVTVKTCKKCSKN